MPISKLLNDIPSHPFLEQSRADFVQQSAEAVAKSTLNLVFWHFDGGRKTFQVGREGPAGEEGVVDELPVEVEGDVVPASLQDLHVLVVLVVRRSPSLDVDGGLTVLQDSSFTRSRRASIRCLP